MSHPRRRPVTTLLLAGALAASCAGPAPAPPTEPTTPTDTIPATTTSLPGNGDQPIAVRIGVTASPAYGIPFVLGDQTTGVAAANGLTALVEIYPDQEAALAAVVAGEADVAFPEGPAALIALGEGACLRAPLVFLDRDVVRMVGISDLIAPDDFIGRKVGTVPGGPGEMALRMWLKEEGIAWDDVHITPLQPEAMAEALTAGEVDAVIWSEPVPGEALAACGEEACRYIDLGGVYREVVPMSVACGWFGAYQDEGMARLVQAWLEAKEFVRNDRRGAATITGDRLHLTADEVLNVWTARDWPNWWAADITDGQLAMLAAYGDYLVESGDLDAVPDLCAWVGTRWLRAVAPERVAVESSAC